MSKNKKPLVSVIMPVYNAGDFLVQAIESILAQTYKNWELIAVDDRSSDDSYKILKAYAKKDKRIQVYRNKSRLNVAANASFALSKAKGEYSARMDADDISYPKRFEKQVCYLLKHKNVILVGSQCEIINKDNEVIGFKKFPRSFVKVKKMIFTSIPVQQPSIMINKNLLPKNFLWYDKEFSVAEEIELLFKLFQYGKVVNLSDTLLKYRIHGNNVSLKNPKHTFYLTLKARFKAIRKYSYRPTFSGLCITIIQTIAITALPMKAIFPVYRIYRGLDIKKKITSQLPQFARV